MIHNLDMDQKTKWNTIKKFSNYPVKKCIQPILKDGKTIFKDEEIAEEFLNVYCSSEIKVNADLYENIERKAKEMLNEQNSHKVLDKDFTMEEFTSALAKTKDMSAISPEEDIHVKMIKEGGNNVLIYLLQFLNECFKRGEHAKESKKDVKIPLPKPWKEDYNVIKAYRLITLESLLNKLLWRMLDERIEWYLESNEILAETQDAYRKERSCNDTVLRIVQSIQEAWSEGKTAVICFLDFESYFENIWRANLICKTHNMGISSKVLKLLNDYLSERQMKINVNNSHSEWKTSYVGIPQGGIISPRLANMYSSDSEVEENINKHAEFADDNIKIEIDEDEDEAMKRMQTRLDMFSTWLSKNNLSCGNTKVKVMTFRPPTAPRPYKQMKLIFNDTSITELDKFCILGTMLTTDLNFDEHVMKTVKSAYQSLKLIKLFSLNQKQPREDTIISLYKSLIRTKIDFSIAAIANISKDSLNKLQTLQRDCLIAATQCKRQTSMEVLNLMTNTLPIDLHLKKKIAEELCRVASRKAEAISSQFEDWFNNKQNLGYCTSYQKMLMAYKQINKHDFIAPEKINLFLPAVNPFEVSNNIIPRKKDCSEQIQHIQNTIDQFDFDYIVGTDGSSFPETGSKLGKTGSAAIVWRKIDGLTKEVGCPVSVKSHNYEAELVGINLGLRVIEEEEIHDASILFLTDCIPAMSMSFQNKIPKDYNQMVTNNIIKLKSILLNNNTVKGMWVPGHKNVPLNEDADKLAKEAAQNSKEDNSKIPDRKLLIIELKENVIANNWKFRIEQELTLHRTYEINNMANGWKQHTALMGHPMFPIMRQLLSGHHQLRGYLSQITGRSAACDCGEVESFEHFVFFCERYTRLRFELAHKIAFILDRPHRGLHTLHLKTIFGQDAHYNDKMNHGMLKSTLDFLCSTKRFKKQ